MPRTPKYITSAQAAAMLNCTRQHISLLIRSGHVAAERMPWGQYIIRESDVKRYAAKRRGPGRPRGSKDRAPRLKKDKAQAQPKTPPTDGPMRSRRVIQL